MGREWVVSQTTPFIGGTMGRVSASLPCMGDKRKGNAVSKRPLFLSLFLCRPHLGSRPSYVVGAKKSTRQMCQTMDPVITWSWSCHNVYNCCTEIVRGGLPEWISQAVAFFQRLAPLKLSAFVFWRFFGHSLALSNACPAFGTLVHRRLVNYLVLKERMLPAKRVKACVSADIPVKISYVLQSIILYPVSTEKRFFWMLKRSK